MSTRGGNSKSGASSSGKSKASSSSHTPTMVVMVGLPGSGKSTFAKTLETYGWAHINQDALGTAAECKKALEKAIKHGKNVVLDRCNVHAKDRKMWVTDAKHFCADGQKYNYHCVFVDTPIDVCKERATARKGHETLDPEEANRVIDEFAQNLKGPESHEGWNQIHHLQSSDDIKATLKEMKLYPAKLK